MDVALHAGSPLTLLLIAAGALHAIIQEQIGDELGHLPLLITLERLAAAR